MTNLILPAQQVSYFFDTYAKALEQYDTKGIAYLYNMPCTMISDDNTAIFNDISKLEGFFNTGTTFYKHFGIARVIPDVWSQRVLTKRIVNVKVNWRYLDVFNNPIYDCEYHYTLKLDKNNQWKIILSISVNEKEKIEQWKKSN